MNREKLRVSFDRAEMLANFPVFSRAIYDIFINIAPLDRFPVGFADLQALIMEDTHERGYTPVMVWEQEQLVAGMTYREYDERTLATEVPGNEQVFVVLRQLCQRSHLVQPIFIMLDWEFVIEEKRRQGIGKKMLSSVINHIQQTYSNDVIALLTHDKLNQAAKNLSKQMGFAFSNACIRVPQTTVVLEYWYQLLRGH